jgi:hypothetical protein
VLLDITVRIVAESSLRCFALNKRFCGAKCSPPPSDPEGSYSEHSQLEHVPATALQLDAVSTAIAVRKLTDILGSLVLSVKSRNWLLFLCFCSSFCCLCLVLTLQLAVQLST